MKRMAKIWALVKKYRMQSVFFSYLKMLGGAALVIIVLYSIVLYGYYQKSQKENMTAFSQEILTTASATMDGMFNEAFRYYTYALSNQYAQMFLQSSQQYLSGDQYRTKIRPILNSLTELVSYSDYISGVWLCSFNNEYVLSTISGGKLENFEQTLWMRHFRETGEEYFVLSAGTQQELFVCRLLQSDGLITVQVNADKLWKNIQSGEYVKQLIISDSQDHIIFSSEPDLTGQELKLFFPAELSYEKLRNGEEFSETDKHGVTVATWSEYDLVYTMQADFPYALEDNMSSLRNFFIGISLIILLMAGILSLTVAMRIYRSIVNVSSFFYPSQNTSEIQKSNEISYISENILNLFQKQKQAEKELEQRRRMLDKANSIALQAQISPHFISNTLQAISACVAAEVREDNEAVQLVLLLGELLRITFDTKDNIIPLDLEIEHAKKYLEIQELKYGGLHTVLWQVEENARKCQTLKLVLQPILENAIEHGFDSCDPDGDVFCRICVHIYQKGHKLFFEISDNGKGMTPEQLNRIRAKMNSGTIAEGSHIGLSNVNQRIRLAFGNAYGVHIESVLGIGTTVVMEMPAVEKV